MLETQSSLLRKRNGIGSGTFNAEDKLREEKQAGKEYSVNMKMGA